MGRKSTKENKNIYQISRETAELTRDSAAAKLVLELKKLKTKSLFHIPMKFWRWLTATKILPYAIIIVPMNVQLVKNTCLLLLRKIFPSSHWKCFPHSTHLPGKKIA